MKVRLIFPHHLFEDIDFLGDYDSIYIIEEYLFFKQYSFHKAKIAFHRASMKYYENLITSKFPHKTTYVESQNELSDIRKLMPHLIEVGTSEIHCFDPSDFYLKKRMLSFEGRIKITIEESPLFLSSVSELTAYFKTKKRFFQTEFYINQRKQRNVLLEPNNEPKGGKWSFDDENRKKYPTQKTPPSVNFPSQNIYLNEAVTYTKTYFEHNLGQLNIFWTYPSTHQEAKEWFTDFLEKRFSDFGTYEDAIHKEEILLHHSLLSPLLNVGLLEINDVINQIIRYSEDVNAPLNDTEGLIRQLIGWREFVRAFYELKGVESRTMNFWGFKRKIPKAFYDGTTGIGPIDDTIKKILKTGYCHHIERLMILGNFMILCEFDPDEVYRWFMELFIDAYDWVMVPNVYAMSQFADGGLLATKPYISGSNYILKMSNYKKAPWTETWDALFWHFMDKQRAFFNKNPRLKMLVSSFDKMPEEKRTRLLERAVEYLESLDKVK